MIWRKCQTDGLELRTIDELIRASVLLNRALSGLVELKVNNGVVKMSGMKLHKRKNQLLE